LDGSRTADAGRLRTFMGIATGLWLVAAIAAITDREALMAVLWFCFVGYGALFVGGAVGRSLGLAYLALGLLVVAVAISMGVFIAD
jgi:hypothetical protein